MKVDKSTHRTRLTIIWKILYVFVSVELIQISMNWFPKFKLNCLIDFGFSSGWLYEPVDSWTETYDAATEKSNICFQLYNDDDQQTEDCLFLSVFTPQTSTSSNITYPVFFNIHGGGFYGGSGTLASGISPKYLLEEDVIVVIFNYRLTALGFLSTGNEVIPGNAGLTDQVLALKWIQRNIAAFGGDPQRVTIAGQSAGAKSVGYLILSPLATGTKFPSLKENLHNGSLLGL
ncbi:hypothetical protein D910_11050 [Dendroctonus ponderosae]|uniref:Carboxylic ester hydrolase n=1 Tax=Dendroctonus ponderosae TaxID=77166 RepID=U4UID9_DENPD|nr:hypothetical protein D910_11050 [Dendroctonus ponderosae]